MSGMPPNGSDDGELSDIAIVRRAYRTESVEEPPRTLDDAIRAAARRAVGARPVAVEPSPGKPGAARRTSLWRGAFAIAATVVLSSSLFVVTLREKDRDDARARVASSAGEAVRSAPTEQAAPLSAPPRPASSGMAEPDSASARPAPPGAESRGGAAADVADSSARPAPAPPMSPPAVADKPVAKARAPVGGNGSQPEAAVRLRQRVQDSAATDASTSARGAAAFVPSDSVEAPSRQADGPGAQRRKEVASRDPVPAIAPALSAPALPAPAEPFPAIAPAAPAPPVASIAAAPPVSAPAPDSIAAAGASSVATPPAASQYREPVPARKAEARIGDSKLQFEQRGAETERATDAVRDIAPSMRSAAKSAAPTAARSIAPQSPPSADAPSGPEARGGDLRSLSERTSADAAAGKDASVAEASPPAPEPPLRWLERIRALRRDGQIEKARVELERFKRAYPDYPLTDKDR